ncbi:glycoside hydrolase family 2 TIM barrel-domain containing protein [Christiangramia sp.]|uniref:glycoside hydrolase family 2 TIM barrel-domain containing protein n=1 Tax=Christiangramia sp. TaxID=1931228 RepID=UPI0026016292|nr:glycoside hydrolase family 2 TIM barrel-domain containing protein [Christiangramia sp.]
MKILQITILLLLLTQVNAPAQRMVKTLNSGWNFQLENSKKSENVNIPHTWNAEDAFNDGAYYRGKGIYNREIFIPQDWKGQAIFLSFEAANQETKVFVNNKFVGEHIGGYTAFVFELTKALNFGLNNEIRVEVDNSHNVNIPPLEADFNFYGGIYRDIELIVTGKTHFQLEGETAGNLLIKTPEVNDKTAEVIFEGLVANPLQNQNLQITITAPNGTKISENIEPLRTENLSVAFEIKNPELWSPDNPKLYELQAQLVEANSGEILDSYSSKFGCRWFKADPKKGFLLNGKPIKLIGANRHQDFENMGNAVPNSIHRKDYQMIKDMGANFIRTAHYPQDPEVYKICDELGLLVWTEIPVINDVTDSIDYHQNSINMQREQILQLYNHPSIIFWGYMNEIFIRLVFTGDMPEIERKAKIATSVELAKKLEAVTKELDTSRLSAMALHENDIYNTSGIANIPDVIGWNLYFGWYTDGLQNLGKFLDDQYQKYPDRPLIISEYGPGSDSRIQTNDPKPWDFSEAYQLKSHISYINQVMDRPFVIGMSAWNFADFGSSGRQDTRPFINQKGLLNFNREPKDIYYYYKARLSDKDFVYIAGKNFEKRFIDKSENVKLNVFSNAEKVILKVDDNPEISAIVKNNVAEFSLDLTEGGHWVEATSGDARHSRKINIQFRQDLLKKLENHPLSINVGSRSDFINEATDETWISDQPYSENSFGYVGGEVLQQSENKFQATFSNLKNTTEEPLYQTMRKNINAYKFDVGKGNYRISLLFAEPNWSASKKNIYNLGSDKAENSEGIRTFDILINGIPVEKNLNIASQYDVLQAVELNYKIHTEKGLNIEFQPLHGQTILSGIRLEKL